MAAIFGIAEWMRIADLSNERANAASRPVMC